MKKLLYILILASVCVSCRSIKYVPIETIKYDSIYINRIKYDSIYHKDSIYISVKGDTVYIYKYQYQYRDKLIRDTVSVTKRDSIPYPVEVVKTVTVEKELSWWQSLFIWTGGITWLVGIIALVVLIKRR
ncbi:MAG: hypothetical protein ACK5LF_16305 [Bacteroides xylanisolvens]